uniref:MFS transporter n=1 Tax=Desertifilum tharense IPPAS B-1220 TaxID=1781255 RepID=A0ACD5GVD6_9CYAN
MHFGFSGKPQGVNPSLPLWFFAFIPFKLGESLLIVTLPLLIVQGVDGTVGDVARIHALTALVGVVGFIFWGNLSDRLRVRRPFLILGFLGFGFCTSLLSFAETLPQAILYSTLNGFFMTSITPASSALVVDSFPEQEWSGYFGRFYQMSGWSFVASLVLGIVWLTGRSSLVDPETVPCAVWCYSPEPLPSSACCCAGDGLKNRTIISLVVGLALNSSVVSQ